MLDTGLFFSAVPEPFRLFANQASNACGYPSPQTACWGLCPQSPLEHRITFCGCALFERFERVRQNDVTLWRKLNKSFHLIVFATTDTRWICPLIQHFLHIPGALFRSIGVRESLIPFVDMASPKIGRSPWKWNGKSYPRFFVPRRWQRSQR